MKRSLIIEHAPGSLPCIVSAHASVDEARLEMRRLAGIYERAGAPPIWVAGNFGITQKDGASRTFTMQTIYFD